MIANPLCARRGCAHYIGMRAKTDGDFGSKFLSPHVPCCAAFPEGIPGEIRSGKNDHTRPVDGDNGITLQESKGVMFFGTEAKSAPATRANPYHDETGKFTTAPNAVAVKDGPDDSVKKK